MADAPRSSDFSLDAAVDAAAARMARGESFDSVLRAYPQHADAMRAPLSALRPILAMPRTDPSPQSRANAAHAMFASIDAPKPQRAPMLAGFRTALSARHMRLQAAAAGLAVLLFGGIGFASAAGDRNPIPVPGFLHILSTSSESIVEIQGTISALATDTLTLRASNGDQTFAIDQATDIRIGDARATFADLAVGQVVTVRASRGMGRTLHASRIDAINPPTATILDWNLVPKLGPGTSVQTPSTSDDGTQARTPKPAESEGTGDKATPQYSDSGTGDDSHNHGGPSPSATTAGGARDDDRTETPSPSHDAEPTEHPPESQSPEPTQKAESTQVPEPTEKPEPTESPY